MELIPVGYQLDRKKPRFVLDENIPFRKHQKLSSQFLPLKAVVRPGTPDWILLERTKEQELILITRDKGLVIRALQEKQDIVYEDQYGNDFYFYGRNTYMFHRETSKGFWKEYDKQKKAEKLANMRVRNVSLNGFENVIAI